MKDKEFVKLLQEYSAEISNPANKQEYEQYISQLEDEARKTGDSDVQYIKPHAGFVLKTSYSKSGKKVFVNVCFSDKIDKGSIRSSTCPSKQGMEITLPHSIAGPWTVQDGASKNCDAFDIVFSSSDYNNASQDSKIKDFMIDVALEAVEKKMKEKVSRKFKIPKAEYKGGPEPRLLAARSSKKESAVLQEAPASASKTQLVTSLEKEIRALATQNSGSSKSASKTQVPKYQIIHRGRLDLQEFLNERESTRSSRPAELLVKIELPLLESAADLDLEFEEKILDLKHTKHVYSLRIVLPFPVDSDHGNATFDKSNRVLHVILPVQKMPQRTSSRQEQQYSEQADGTQAAIMMSKEETRDANGTQQRNPIEEKIQELSKGPICVAGESAGILESQGAQTSSRKEDAPACIKDKGKKETVRTNTDESGRTNSFENDLSANSSSKLTAMAEDSSAFAAKSAIETKPSIAKGLPLGLTNMYRTELE
eukprot:CAMPEP_0184646686 /NCGR_PEP_ID=MMETSP0308-20130426/3421_1 /TAXON_ID=38269 /ORGANISM="Gloeochaete witrockiana, Strain SAG 46.84" /LENGTH=481 /DNA_ID=CAMNT_0027076931 /DNA_START=79 /DNA_END=1524 /DNA_ORIENTATION=-